MLGFMVQEMLNPTEYGAMGALVIALTGALIWHLRTTTTSLLNVVKTNTIAMAKLEAALKDQRLCPYAEQLERHAHNESYELPAQRARAATAG